MLCKYYLKINYHQDKTQKKTELIQFNRKKKGNMFRSKEFTNQKG